MVTEVWESSSVAMATRKRQKCFALWTFRVFLFLLSLLTSCLSQTKTQWSTRLLKFTKYFKQLEVNNFNYSWFQTFAVFWMLYSFFWVILRNLNFICRRFGTLCSIFIGANKDGTECSETSAYKIQKPGNRPKERIKLHRNLRHSQRTLSAGELDPRATNCA